MTKYKISIQGMHCASCASNVERALKKLTSSVSVSILTNKAFAESDRKPEELKQAIEKIGYKVTSIEVA